MNFDQIYTSLCKFAGKSSKLKNVNRPSEELQKNLMFCGIEVSAGEVSALALLGAILGGALVTIVLFLTLLWDLSFFIFSMVAPLPVVLFFSIGWYPSWKVDAERAKSWGDTFHLVSYLVVALKINPNLERAAKFTARGRGESLIGSFKDDLWKACIGVYSNVDEALFKFAKRWKGESDELKRSIDLVRSSLSEKEEETRKKVLDRALKTTFEGVRSRMRDYASELQLPITMIYGIGVLLPLVLVAVLPVISSTGFQISALELAFIYGFALPLAIYLLQKHVLSKRPAVFVSSGIPSLDDEKRAILISISVAIVPPGLALFLGLGDYPMVLITLWSLSTSISLFCYLSSKDSFNIQQKNSKLEEEFHEAMVQLGSRLKSNRPAEDAFRRTAETTRGSEISKIFKRTSTNLRVGGMDIYSALFDPEEGSLRRVYSLPIRNTFRFLADLLDKSARAAGEATLFVTGHLKKLSEVENKIKRDLREVVSSMKSVALLFAPFVASITVQLQRMLSKKTRSISFLGGSMDVSTPVFSAVLGLYIIVLTVLLSSFVSEIEHGDNSLIKSMEIAQALPVAMSVFTLGLLMGEQIFSILVG